MAAHHLHWPHGQATVLTTAAMLANCMFALPNAPFSLFARAPWIGQVHDPTMIGHLRELGGDFACLPFRIGRPTPGAPPEWSAVISGPAQGPIHDPTADADWGVVAASDMAITLALDYPDASPVLRVERTLTARPDAPALDCTFRIFARLKTAISAGLHPILRLPGRPGRLHISADFALGLVHPGNGGAEFQRLDAVPRTNVAVDLSHVPLSPRSDLSAQQCGMRGPLRATYLDEDAGLDLDWDRSLLPSLQIWHIDGGISPAPWNNAYS